MICRLTGRVAGISEEAVVIERDGLGYEAGTSERLLSSFYGLLRLTRRRHGLPPQPLAWFQNLVACLRDSLAVHVASKDGRAIASILTMISSRAGEFSMVFICSKSRSNSGLA